MKTEALAQTFLHTFYKKTLPKTCLTSFDQISLKQSYEVQDKVMAHRVAKGEKVLGYKVGCTSQAIQKQFGLDEPIYARLYEPYIYNENDNLDWSNYVNCAIEPEMVFKISKNLQGFDLSDEELIDGIEYISPGIELHHFKFWRKPETLQELICSGGIHAGLVIGKQKVEPQKLSFSDEVFSVYKNEKLITHAKATEIMGGPLNSLRWLVRKLTEKKELLEKGSLVIPGSPVELVTIDENTILKVEIDLIGTVQTMFVSSTD